MKQNLLLKIDEKELKHHPVFFSWNSFSTGDLLSIVMLSSMDNKRKTNFLGLCISKKNKGLSSNFTLRNVISNEGVEFTIPYYSPLLKSISILNRKKTRASKLYYVRKFPNLKVPNFKNSI
jgi:ribosomal protein L19